MDWFQTHNLLLVCIKFPAMQNSLTARFQSFPSSLSHHSIAATTHILWSKYYTHSFEKERKEPLQSWFWDLYTNKISSFQVWIELVYLNEFIDDNLQSSICSHIFLPKTIIHNYRFLHSISISRLLPSTPHSKFLEHASVHLLHLCIFT